MLTKALVIPRAVPCSSILVTMKERTVLIMAFSIFLEIVTFWHAHHVIEVKKLAVVSLLAQMPQPVLADN
jgi:hypothetical protein